MSDLPPIGPYTYRVRALLADGSASPYSNLASASVRPPLTACAPSVSDLCLLAGRFRVSVAWRDAASGRSGSATGISQSDQTGLYWFFDESNIELIVKMIDGTSLNEFFWFFYGGLSTVEYWITVEDTVLDRSVTYHNPRGQLCGQLDTSAFGEEGAAARLTGTEATAVPVAVRRVASAGETGACVPDESSLCFLDGRFRVEVDWHRGETNGVGRPVPLSGGRSGMFWFFSPSNIELIVKLIDGSAVNGKLWFFFGALSNVEYDVKVTDTTTGEQRIYHNPQGDICGQADTAAFDP